MGASGLGRPPHSPGVPGAVQTALHPPNVGRFLPAGPTSHRAFYFVLTVI